MHELYDDLMDMCETLSKELTKTNEKLRKVSGSISASDMDYINKLTHAIKSVKTTMAMLDSEYSNAGPYRYESHEDGGNDGASYRGRGRNAKRDAMGRYSSERGYSRNEMMDSLYDLRDSAPDERTRQELDRMINKMQSM